MSHRHDEAYPKGPYFYQKARAIGSALFRFLQHSTEGDLGDTNINRVLLADDAVKLMGDSAGNPDNESVRLGSHTATGPTTNRTTANKGSAAGWTDPDGTSNGMNSLTTDSSNTNPSVAASSRLWNEVGDPSGSNNVDAWDDLYTLTFKVTADRGSMIDGDFNPVEVLAQVQIEYSTNGGTNWTTLPTVYTANSSIGGGLRTETFNPTITVAGTLTQLRIRLALAGATMGTPVAGSGAVSCQVFNTTWLSNTYPVTWQTSGTAVSRRGLKLFSRLVPHLFMEPLATTPSPSSVVEGELAFVGGSVQNLFGVRNNGLYPLMQKDAVKAYPSSSLTIGTSEVVVNWNSNEFAVGNVMHSTSVNTSRITVTIPGIYLLAVRIEWNDPNVEWEYQVRIRKNGTTNIGKDARWGGVPGTAVPWTVGFTIIDLASANDYYEVLVFNQSGSNKTLIGGIGASSFCAAMVS